MQKLTRKQRVAHFKKAILPPLREKYPCWWDEDYKRCVIYHTSVGKVIYYPISDRAQLSNRDNEWHSGGMAKLKELGVI